MNPGPLLILFLAWLAYLVARRRPLLLFVWVVLFLAFPFLRNKYGALSIYWCDLASLGVLVAFYRPARPRTKLQTIDKWYVLLCTILLIGVLGTFIRYRLYLQPTYLTLRNASALLPLIIIPRIVRREEAMKWVGRALVVSAILVGLVALAQTLSRSAAMTMEEWFSGGHELTRSEGHIQRLYRIEAVDVLRVYGMYGSSTAFAGATALMGFSLIAFRRLVSSRALFVVALVFCFTATLLTYSRHGVIALLVFGSVLTLLQPRRVLWVIGAGLAMAAVAGFFLSASFWGERLQQGGLAEDPSLRRRLVEGPSELADRLVEDPLVAVYGAGLGVEWVLPERELDQAQYGFVSNTFLLYFFYAGVAGFLAYAAFFFALFRRARRLAGRARAIGLAALAGAIIVVASDNYAFFKTSVPFLWALVGSWILVVPTKRELRLHEMAEAGNRRPSPRGSPMSPPARQPVPGT